MIKILYKLLSLTKQIKHCDHEWKGNKPCPYCCEHIWVKDWEEYRKSQFTIHYCEICGKYEEIR